MKRRPLPDDLAPGPRILELVRRNAGQGIRGDVADAIAARLDGVHLDGREIGQDVGHVLDPRPVVLDVLARGEMTVAAVVAARDRSEGAQLRRGEKSVRDRDAQHGRVALDVQPIAQPQMPELVVRQLACEKAPSLIAKLRHALVDQRLVDHIVAVHHNTVSPRRRHAQ